MWWFDYFDKSLNKFWPFLFWRSSADMPATGLCKRLSQLHKITKIRNTKPFCCWKFYKGRFSSCCWHCSFSIGGKNRQNFGHPVSMSLGARMPFLYKWLSLHLPRNILLPRQHNNCIKSILSPQTQEFNMEFGKKRSTENREAPALTNPDFVLHQINSFRVCVK